MGSKVYFAPSQQNSVGVVDTVTNTFTQIATGLSGEWKFCGAAALDHFIYFAGQGLPDVGVLDTASNTFSTISTGGGSYVDALAFESKVYLQPLAQLASLRTIGILTIHSAYGTDQIA